MFTDVVDYHALYLSMKLITNYFTDLHTQTLKNQIKDNRPGFFESLLLKFNISFREPIAFDTQQFEEIILFRDVVMRFLCDQKQNNHLYKIWMEHWKKEAKQGDFGFDIQVVFRVLRITLV